MDGIFPDEFGDDPVTSTVKRRRVNGENPTLENLFDERGEAESTGWWEIPGMLSGTETVGDFTGVNRVLPVPRPIRSRGETLPGAMGQPPPPIEPRLDPPLNLPFLDSRMDPSEMVTGVPSLNSLANNGNWQQTVPQKETVGANQSIMHSTRPLSQAGASSSTQMESGGANSSRLERREAGRAMMPHLSRSWGRGSALHSARKSTPAEGTRHQSPALDSRGPAKTLRDRDGVAERVQNLWGDSPTLLCLSEMCDGPLRGEAIMKEAILQFVPSSAFRKDAWSRKLKSLSKVDLENICLCLGLRKMGRKQELISRITSTLSGLESSYELHPARNRSSPGAPGDNGLAKYNFMIGESPYNTPVAPPLGGYKVFAGLTMDKDDPTVYFATPSSAWESQEVQVHLRCLKVDPKCKPEAWRQYWPFPSFAKVNDHIVQLNQAQRFTNGKLAGSDMATNITPYLRRKPGGVNVVSLKRNRGGGNVAVGSFVTFVQEVQITRTDQAIENVRKQSALYWSEQGISAAAGSGVPMNPLECDAAGVRRFMKEGGVSVESVKVSLRCPLALVKMETPVRSKFCAHVQCFDLRSYVEYTRRSLKFECPFCNRARASPDLLIVSPFIEGALSAFPNADEIEIKSDGSYSEVAPVMNEGDSSSGEGNTVKVPRVPEKSSVVVDLTLESDDDVQEAQVRPTCRLGVSQHGTAPLADMLADLEPPVDAQKGTPSPFPLHERSPFPSPIAFHRSHGQPEDADVVINLDLDSE